MGDTTIDNCCGHMRNTGGYMGYSIEIIKKAEHKTSEWSGGTTTQLFIFPREAEYSKRNFKWRLSSAKVEVEESTFTYLQGISRIIMVLEGTLRLHHQGHHSVELKPFEKDSFSGEWTTKSFGRVTDFNLMMTEGCKGNVEVIEISAKENLNLVLGEKASMEDFSEITKAFYCVEGQVELITENDERLRLFEGDLALITSTTMESKSMLRLYNNGDEVVRVIQTTVYLRL